tara:strand:+ start:4796 stop:5122 length:327 start_codon:yes stop_codon:yes gene_type:complete
MATTWEVYNNMMVAKERQEKFGGSMWDIMTIFMTGDDEKFIEDFVKRMPCYFCIGPFFTHKKELNIEFNKDVETNRRNLWSIRCLLLSKYKDTDDDFKKYLNFLILDK